MKEMNIEIPAEYAYVPGVRNCVGRIACDFGFDDTESYQIETVVDEICNNAIEHGTKEGSNSITIECTFDKDKLEMSVRDNGGKQFDVKDVLKKNLRLLEIGPKKEDIGFDFRGRGLLVVQRFVDKLDIHTGKNGTLVSIVKKHKRKKEL